MAAHLQEAAIVEPVLANEEFHCRLHVVVDAAPAPEQRECPIVGVKHHLLRLARIGPHLTAFGRGKAGHGRPSRSPGHRHAAQQHNLVAPVEQSNW